MRMNQMNQENWAADIPPQVGCMSMIRGEPGCGKSARWDWAAKHTQRIFKTWFLNRCMPEDLGGIPVVNTDGITFRRVVDELVWEAMSKPSILFLDEFSDAPTTVMAAAQEIMNNPPPNAWMVGACNPSWSATNGADIPTAIVNRVVIVDYVEPTNSWLEALEADEPGLDDIPFRIDNFPIVPPDWRQIRPSWSKLVAKFLRQNPKFSEGGFPEDVEEQSQSWTSKRTWTKAIYCLSGADAVGANDETKGLILKGLLGYKTATAFWAWLGTVGLPDPQEVLDNAFKFQVPRAADRALAIFRSVVGHVRQQNDGECWEQGMDLVGVVYNQRPEYGMMIGALMEASKPKGHAARNRDDEVSKEMANARTQTAGV